MTRIPFFLFLSLLLFPFPMTAAQAHQHGDGSKHGTDDVKIIDVSDDIKVIQAGGGNIAVLKGSQGFFVIDNGLAEKADAVMTAVESISEQPVKIIANTHWHYDHAGNNAGFAAQGATLIAHDNVRKRLAAGGTIGAFDKEIEPADNKALPILTYTDGVNVHLNGKQASIVKMPNAHTDGDSIIYWKEDNVIHTGDLFFNGFWPFVDASSGGSLRGMIQATDEILDMVDEDTKIIPGHGPMATKDDLRRYNDMLKIVANKVRAEKEAGVTKEKWIKNNPLADLSDKWGNGFLPTDAFTAIIWDAY